MSGVKDKDKVGSNLTSHRGTISSKLALFAPSLTLTLTLDRATLDMLGAERSRTI